MPSPAAHPPPTSQLSITIDASQRAELRRIAEAEDRPLAWLVRTAVHEFLARRAEAQAD